MTPFRTRATVATVFCLGAPAFAQNTDLTTRAELEVVRALVEGSYSFITGKPV